MRAVNTPYRYWRYQKYLRKCQIEKLAESERNWNDAKIVVGCMVAASVLIVAVAFFTK